MADQVPADEWSYIPPGTGDPDAPEYGDVDIVRFFVQDTDPALRLIRDIELQYLIDTWMPKYDSLIYVAYVAAQTIASKFAGMVAISADGVSVQVGDLTARYTALADRLHQLHEDAAIGGEIDLSNLGWDAELDWTIAPLVFSLGQHDNLEAGQQNYGGHGVRTTYEDRVGWY